jgi:hypothetical protein
MLLAAPIHDTIIPDCQSESESELASRINHNPDLRFRFSFSPIGFGIGMTRREARVLLPNLQDSMLCFLFCASPWAPSILLLTVVGPPATLNCRRLSDDDSSVDDSSMQQINHGMERKDQQLFRCNLRNKRKPTINQKCLWTTGSTIITTTNLWTMAKTRPHKRAWNIVLACKGVDKRFNY